MYFLIFFIFSFLIYYFWVFSVFSYFWVFHTNIYLFYLSFATTYLLFKIFTLIRPLGTFSPCWNLLNSCKFLRVIPVKEKEKSISSKVPSHYQALPVYICVFQIYLRGEGWGEGSFFLWHKGVYRYARTNFKIKLILAIMSILILTFPYS